MVDSDKVIKFAETVLDMALLEYQKRMVEKFLKMPPDTHIAMGKNGKIYFYSKKGMKEMGIEKEQLIDTIHSEFEKRMIEGFERHGYSKAWLTDPRNTERVVATELMTEDGVIKSFSVDGKEIFKIAQCIETDVDPVLGPCVSKMVLKIYDSEENNENFNTSVN